MPKKKDIKKFQELAKGKKMELMAASPSLQDVSTTWSSVKDESKPGLPKRDIPKLGLLKKDVPKRWSSLKDESKPGSSKRDLPKPWLSKKGIPKPRSPSKDESTPGSSSTDESGSTETLVIKKDVPKPGSSSKDESESGLSNSDLPKSWLSKMDLPKPGSSPKDESIPGLSKKDVPKPGSSSKDESKSGLSKKDVPKPGSSSKDESKSGLSKSDLPKSWLSKMDLPIYGSSSTDESTPGLSKSESWLSKKDLPKPGSSSTDESIPGLSKKAVPKPWSPSKNKWKQPVFSPKNWFSANNAPKPWSSSKDLSNPWLTMMNIFVLGAKNTGKTAFMMRHKTGEFVSEYNPDSTFSRYDHEFYTNRGRIRFCCWVADKLDCLKNVNIAGVIILTDATSSESFKEVISYQRKLYKRYKLIPIVICGNKMDEGDAAGIRWKLYYKLIKNLKFYDISVKYDYNCELPFLYLCQELMGDPMLRYVDPPAEEPPKGDLNGMDIMCALAEAAESELPNDEIDW